MLRPAFDRLGKLKAAGKSVQETEVAKPLAEYLSRLDPPLTPHFPYGEAVV
jgi:hypothetical protein